MALPAEAELLRIYVDELDMQGDHPVYKVVVEAACKRGLAGATALRGVIGFGAGACIHAGGAFQIWKNLPMVIEIVDRPERIAEFLHELKQIMHKGLVTLEKVRVVT
jgi:hypothetical protein